MTTREGARTLTVPRGRVRTATGTTEECAVRCCRYARRNVAHSGSDVLTDAPRPGRRTRLTPARIAAIVTATLTSPPGATPWSTRMMAHAQDVSEKSIRNI